MSREMLGDILRTILKLSIPVALVAANLFFPLALLARQASIGILLIWLYIEVLMNFRNQQPPVSMRQAMKRYNFTPQLFYNCLYALLAVAATTVLLMLIGRETLGEAVIALLYLVPVVWSAARWGQGPGMAAALSAALLFDFYFIPPFYTFTVGSLEGWLVLAIFLAVAIVVVSRIQASLSRAQASEREAIIMYELSAALAGLRTQDAVAHIVARFLHERYLASLVTVSIQPKGQPTETAAYEPHDGILAGKPDRILPILNAWGLVGEVQIWRGEIELPSEESRLFQNFASQIGQALERTRLAEAETQMNAAIQPNTTSK